MIVQIFLSCSKEDFNIDNPNYPKASDVLADENDFKNYNISNHNLVFQNQVSLTGVFFRALADQMTTTNAYLGFWTFTDEPRLSLPNSTANNYLRDQIGAVWYDSYEIINNVNIIQKTILNDGLIIQDEDITNQELAGSYFDKGVALGYLSMVYDRAFIVDYDTEANELELNDYNQVLEAALENLQKAIDLANSLPSFEYQLYTGGPILDKDLFIQLAYSYMARFAISVPRTDAEAQTLDYNRILGFANNGIVENFWPESNSDFFYHDLQWWNLWIMGDDGMIVPEFGQPVAGYMPTDIKIAHLFDPAYPVEYPTESGVVLPPANSDDPRLVGDNKYYIYVGDNFGYLRESRGRHLFSSYIGIRFWDDNDEGQNGLPVQIFPKAEIDYIKAECYYRMGDYASAVQALDASPRMTVGNQSTTPSQEAVRNALFYENSIELDLNSGIAIHWAFMRRHDLLQKGTAYQYPIPASELEVQQLPIYTYGGDANAGQEGTAAGNNDWRNIDLTY